MSTTGWPLPVVLVVDLDAGAVLCANGDIGHGSSSVACLPVRRMHFLSVHVDGGHRYPHLDCTVPTELAGHSPGKPTAPDGPGPPGRADGSGRPPRSFATGVAAAGPRGGLPSLVVCLATGARGAAPRRLILWSPPVTPACRRACGRAHACRSPPRPRGSRWRGPGTPAPAVGRASARGPSGRYRPG